MLLTNSNFNKHKTFFQNCTSEGSGYNYAIWAIIGIGVFLRLFHFFYNRSFWVDETYLSNSLIRMNFLELAIGPLEYEQKAPIGYLWVVKACVLFLGKAEMPLRLFPLVGSLISLLVFLPIVKTFLRPFSAAIAMGILALAPYLIYHAVEAKQYSIDVLATVLCLYLYIYYHNETKLSSRLLWGIGGAFILWFSYSAIFVLAGIAIGTTFYYLFKRDWASLFQSILPFSMWMISFLINYILFTHKHAGSGWLEDWFRFRDAFMPLPPTSKEGVIWFFKAIYTVFRYPLGMTWFESENENIIIKVFTKMPLMPLLLLMLALGFYTFFKKESKFFWVLTFPILLTTIASSFELYPFYERTIVFLAPLFIIILVNGSEKLTVMLRLKGKWQYLLPLLLLTGPVFRSAREFINPHLLGQYKNTTIREALFYLKDNIKPGDVVYIYWNFNHHYRYYKEAYKLQFGKVVEGKDMRTMASDTSSYMNNLQSELETIKGANRIWLLYDKRHREAIGDQLGEPAWYYSHMRPSTMIYKKFTSMGKEEKDSYQSGGLGIIPFRMPNK